jgi:hypothetical protein
VSAVHTGGCLCGGVRYRIDGPLREVIGCHCSQCRRTSGHFVAATRAALKDVHLLSDATLRWYESSAEAQRGFCSRCGGNLFWKPRPQVGEIPMLSIMAGTLDTPTGLRFMQHIFVADKSDYYHIDDAVPQLPHSN